MKTTLRPRILLLVGLTSLGCNRPLPTLPDAPAAATDGASDGATGATQTIEYREVQRTYRGLASIDLDVAGCQRSFRLLNGNWMDCKLRLPSPGFSSPLQQIYPAQFPVVDREQPGP